MKLAVICVLVAVVALAYAAPKPDEDKYKSKLDNINVDEVLKNERLFNNHLKCFLDKGKCNPDGRDIKEQVIDLLPEILETNCAKCTEDQKTKVRKILRFLHDNKKESFDELLNKYDAGSELRTKYKEKYGQLSKDEGFADIFE